MEYSRRVIADDGGLLPCPFCGEQAAFIEEWGGDQGQFAVQCHSLIGCHASSGYWSRVDDAVSAWNRRSS